MKTRTAIERQSLGCGYLPPLSDKKRLTIWQPPTGEHGYKGPELTVCAGYTVNLPEVVEAAKARAHWKHGALMATLDGECADEEFLDAILVFDAACGELESWLMTPSKDGGGGK